MEEYVYLNLEDVLGYYCETIEQSGGGMLGVREREGIEKILDFVQNDVYYPTLEDKLTYMVFAFCTGHYFADGNKRISLVVGAHFLVKNKRAWAGFNFLPYMEAYIWHVAAVHDLDRYAKYLKDKHSEEILGIYKEKLIWEAAQGTGRDRYESIARSMRVMQSLKRGQEAVHLLAEFFRQTYRNRRAMMEIIREF